LRLLNRTVCPEAIVARYDTQGIKKKSKKRDVQKSGSLVVEGGGIIQHFLKTWVGGDLNKKIRDGRSKRGASKESERGEKQLLGTGNYLKKGKGYIELYQ